jgi:hypothetical protein
MGEHKSRTPRHYIIVVHGIGEQKLNQTATEVVHRFAEVRWKDRHPNVDPRKYQILLPADLSGQSVRRRGAGHGWSEFNGIPVDPADDTYAFDGKPATDTSGRNFRFVDLHWQHILQWHQKEYASPAEKWGPAVLERIGEEKGMVPKGWIPEWATPLLSSIVKTAVPVKKLLSWRYPDLTKLMFDDYLGDVHLYGDYARTRGKAVRHFHVILDEIHLRDFINWCLYERVGGDEYEPPVYSIFAHSLGSIMSFDALAYAYATEDVRTGRTSVHHTSPSLPYPGYTEAADCERDTWARLIRRAREEVKEEHELKSRYLRIAEENKETEGHPMIPPLMWRDCVKTFITVGSPIDKYHVIWFRNYFHMGLRTKNGATPAGFMEKWAEGWLEEPQSKIIHYNLCDEQDPVGHHLDVAQTSLNYKKVFDTSIPVTYRDVVFRRYAVPGLAHVKYWEDGDLFKGIVKEVIDREKVIEGPDPDLTEYERQRGLAGSYFLRLAFRNRKGVYEKTLNWAYFRIPLFAALVTGGLLSYGLLNWVQSGFGISYLAAIVAAILLWTCPRPTEVYAEEAESQEVRLEEKGLLALWWERWKPRRSILGHLVAGMVEWRRVLLLLSAGQSTDREECLQKGRRLAFKKGKERTGQFRKNLTIRLLMAAAVLGVSVLLAFPVGIIISLSYVGTMLYVFYLYKKAIERWEDRTK